MVTYVKPDASNTGPRATDLAPYSTSTKLTASTTLEGVAITGTVTAKGAGVVLVVRDFTWRRPATGHVVPAFRAESGAKIILEYGELDGGGDAEIGVSWDSFDVRWCEIRGFNDGIRVGRDTVVRHNWIHGLARRGTLHPDCIQATGGTGIDIQWNALDAKESSEATAGSGLDIGNSCFQGGNENYPRYPTSRLDQLVISNNWCSGGNYAINVRPDFGVLDVTIANNIFDGNHRYGPVLIGQTPVASGNVMENGSPAPIKRTK